MFAMCRRSVNSAAAADAAGVSSCVETARQCANTNSALILDAALLASIFVAAAIVSLLGSSALFIIVISIILVSIIALLVTASGRYGEPT